jgi:hypothetical protein
MRRQSAARVVPSCGRHASLSVPDMCFYALHLSFRCRQSCVPCSVCQSAQLCFWKMWLFLVHAWLCGSSYGPCTHALVFSVARSWSLRRVKPVLCCARGGRPSARCVAVCAQHTSQPGRASRGSSKRPQHGLLCCCNNAGCHRGSDTQPAATTNTAAATMETILLHGRTARHTSMQNLHSRGQQQAHCIALSGIHG